jgi:UDP-galactopyranose mutase
MPHLIVFSHLRWNFVFQRPQHLLSRLAAEFPVVFVEEPQRSDGPSHLEQSSPAPGVQVLRPHTPVDAPGFHDDQLSLLEPMVADWLAQEGIDDYAVWFYTPMALPLLNVLAPRAVIYDCMDELSAFKGAPRQMRQRETALLKRAALVLTGGPSLYEAKRSLHPNVMCLPSAVDAAHYANANAVAHPERMRRAGELQGALPAPRLGFFGVIDERIDVGLVEALADAEPGWQIVMAGPVVKIDPATLPQRPNLHWLGQQPYELLPQLVAGWDVCLMPFAINESTRFISPTKTLEYMAAGKPVVSTRIRDVEVMFGDLVAIADEPSAFVSACRAALAETDEDRARRQADMATRVGRHAWDATAASIAEAIRRVLVDRPIDQEAVAGANGASGGAALPKVAAAGSR